jgi:hypothetical protein
MSTRPGADVGAHVAELRHYAESGQSRFQAPVASMGPALKLRFVAADACGGACGGSDAPGREGRIPVTFDRCGPRQQAWRLPQGNQSVLAGPT